MQFAKASLRVLQASQQQRSGDRSSGTKTVKQQRTGDARRGHLLHARAGAYVPYETKSVVVDSSSNASGQRALAADGFVAVNGDGSSDDDSDGCHETRDAGHDATVAAAVAAQARTQRRGSSKRVCTIDDTFDTLERAEAREMAAQRTGGRSTSSSKWRRFE